MVWNDRAVRVGSLKCPAGSVLLQAYLQIAGGGASRPFPGLMDDWERGVWHRIDTVEDRCLFDQRETIRACLGWWN